MKKQVKRKPTRRETWYGVFLDGELMAVRPTQRAAEGLARVLHTVRHVTVTWPVKGSK